MGRELAIAFPEAREQFELADRVLADRYEQPLSSYMFPPPSFTPEDKERRQAELTDTHVAQAALGATELAYMRVLEELGVEPQLTAGHSYGEFAALAAAGGIDAEQLLAVSEARGRFMKEAAAAEAGAMAAVDAPPERADLAARGRRCRRRQPQLAPPDRALGTARARRGGARVVPRARASARACCRSRARFTPPTSRAPSSGSRSELEQTTIAAPRIPVYSNTTRRSPTPRTRTRSRSCCPSI